MNASQCAEAAAEIPASAAASFYDAVDLHRREMRAFVRAEHRIPLPGVATERGQFAPDPRGEQHDAGFAALPEHGDLAGIVTRLQVAPGERAQLGDAQRAGVEQPEQGVVPGVGLKGEQPEHIALTKDPLR